MDTKELAKHFRKRLKVANVPARVKMHEACGSFGVKVSAPKFGFEWTPEQLDELYYIAAANHMTGVRGLPLDRFTMRKLTGAGEFTFYPSA